MLQFLITSYQRCAFHHCLCYEHSIKRVAMQEGQGFSSDNMWQTYRQQFKTNPNHIIFKINGCFKFSNHSLDGNFPQTDQAYQHPIGWITYC